MLTSRELTEQLTDRLHVSTTRLRRQRKEVKVQRSM